MWPTSMHWWAGAILISDCRPSTRPVARSVTAKKRGSSDAAALVSQASKPRENQVAGPAGNESAPPGPAAKRRHTDRHHGAPGQAGGAARSALRAQSAPAFLRASDHRAAGRSEDPSQGRSRTGSVPPGSRESSHLRSSALLPIGSGGAYRGPDRNLLDNVEAKSIQRHDFLGMVGEQSNIAQT